MWLAISESHTLQLLTGNIKPEVPKHFRYLGTKKVPPHTHQCPKTTPMHLCQKTHSYAKSTSMQQQQQHNLVLCDYTCCSPHPPTCVWVGWVFILVYVFVCVSSSSVSSFVSFVLALVRNICATSSTTSNTSSTCPIHSNFSLEMHSMF